MAGMVGARPAQALRSGAVEETHLQRDQPTGVPPLELTGERTLPDVPEENYWYRRHLAVYEWIAARVAGAAGRRPRLRRGLRLGRARRRGRGGHRRRRQPRGARARAAALPAPEPALRARPGRGVLRGALRRDRLPADDRAHPRARARCSSGFAATAPVAYVSTPNRLTLAPRRAPRSPTTPGTCASTRPPSTAALLEPRFSRVELFGLFHARKLRAARARDPRRLGPRPPGAADHQALLRPLRARRSPPRDFALRAEAECDLDRALDFLAVCRA